MTLRRFCAGALLAVLLSGCGADGPPQAYGAGATGQRLANRVFSQ